MSDGGSDEGGDLSEASRSTSALVVPRTPERRGRTVISAIFLAFSVLFIGWCTWDITESVFAIGGNASGDVDAVPDAACAGGVKELAHAVERALALRTPVAGRPVVTLASFEEALGPEWNEASPIEARCAVTSGGARAYAAVARFRTGAREAMHHDLELAPLRQEMAPYLAN